ncbi:MAG: VWA domain-containing protein [Ignavibacteriaceae bacterium]|nr:VWA domain-containing protein [Ignavibacteriaceae bacterium]
MFNDITFAFPWVLYFLAIIPLMAVWYWIKKRKSHASITYSSVGTFKDLSPTIRERLRFFPDLLRLLAIGLFIVALARPQTFSSGENVYTEGIDIAMVLDISGSMLAEDLKPNRLEAAKNVMDEFISARTSDRIGLVVFARDAFTQCPLTIDYSVLRNLLSQIKSGMIEDGTAIGNAIANGVNRLKDSNAKSKVVILLTDGVNNAGEVDPVSAAEIAKTFGVRIYTIGVGTRGEAPYPVATPFGTRYQMIPVEIDENILKEIANTTGGKYFRATNNTALVNIYKEIDSMEKAKVEITSYRNAAEMFYGWLGAGLLLILLEFGLNKTVLRKLP